MSRLGTVKFSGKSGSRYLFEAYPLETVFEKGCSGVYVVTRRRAAGSGTGFVHRRICTGQSDDLRRPVTGHGTSWSARGANCICVHVEEDKDIRQQVKQDLVRKPRPAADA